MDTLEAYKAATLGVIQAHLADYAKRIAECDAHIAELEDETSMNHVATIAGEERLKDIAQCKRVALLSLKRDLYTAELI